MEALTSIDHPLMESLKSDSHIAGSVTLRHLEKHRKVLLQDIHSLTQDILDWKILPNTMTIGTSLLHVAAFEFLLSASLPGGLGTEDRRGLWARLKAGFSRTINCVECTGKSLEYYLLLLDQVRARTVKCLQHVDLANTGIPSFESTLLAVGATSADVLVLTPCLMVKALTMMAETEDVSVGNGTAGTEILQMILQHEAYHRGQITFQKYLYKDFHLQRS